MRAQKRALVEGGELRLVIPADSLPPAVLALTGLDRLTPTFTDLDQALEAAPAAAAPSQRRRRRPTPGMRTRGRAANPTRC